MRHYLIATSPELPWSTLGERLSGAPPDLARLPSDYVVREEAALDVVRLFLAGMREGRCLSYRIFYVYDDFPERLNPDFHPLVYDGLGSKDALRDVLASPFEGLDLGGQLLVFRLAVRGLIAVCVESADGVRLSTTDEGFYWFLSLPDEISPSALVRSGSCKIIESSDILSDE